MEKLEVLKNYFGYSTFRKGQEDLIDWIIGGRDILGIMPTGSGKSICYQLPALLSEGITLVISPLISLMKDQVHALTQAGIAAAYLNSSLSYGQYLKALHNAVNNQYKIIYVAPERLQTDEFIRFACNANISIVTVDEAHCVSQWGQDFRPGYLKIVDFIRELPNRPIVTAFTATATANVRDDIIEKLQLKNPYTLTTGFDRENLYFSVLKPKDKFATLMKYLKENQDSYGIVYCATRKTVEEVCKNLKDAGFPVTKYHAGLTSKERKDNQDEFIYDRANIMVATNAFGMGIDKSNVSFVIHYNMPKNIESYYQEAGRAGRDGGDADCILFYSGQDVVINQFFIENSGDNESLDEATKIAIKKKDKELLKKMTFYCYTHECLRRYILNYFGEKRANYCGNCSSCNTNYEEMDVTAQAQKIISCTQDIGQRFGTKTIVDILRGSKNKRIRSAKLDRTSTYGMLSGVSESKIRDIIMHLVLAGSLEITDGEYPVVKLGVNSRDVFMDDCTIKMKVFKDDSPDDKYDKSQTSASHETIDEDLFGRLRALRNRIASSQRVPAYIVFADAALRDMCTRLPANSKEFLNVTGVGQAKLEKYGDEFLKEINGSKDV